MTRLGEALATEIDRRDMSQREAAELLGTTQQTVSKWVNGETVPDTDYIPAIANFLRMSRTQTRDMIKGQRRERVQAKKADRSRLADLERGQVELRGRVDDLTTRLDHAIAAIEKLLDK